MKTVEEIVIEVRRLKASAITAQQFAHADELRLVEKALRQLPPIGPTAAPWPPYSEDWQARAEKAEAELAAIKSLFEDIKTIPAPKFDKRKRKRK